MNLMIIFEVKMKKISVFLFICLQISTGFALTPDPNKEESRASIFDRVALSYPSHKLNSLVLKDLHSYFEHYDTYGKKTIWITEPGLLKEIDNECAISTKQMNKYLQREGTDTVQIFDGLQRKKVKFSKSVWFSKTRQELLREQKCLERTLALASFLSKSRNTKPIAEYLKSQQVSKRLSRSKGFLNFFLCHNFYHNFGSEAYMQSLLAFANHKKNGFYFFGGWADVPMVPTLYSESGDPRCLEILQKAVVRHGEYSVYKHAQTILSFLIAEGGVVNDAVIHKGLSYPSDAIRLWAVKKVCNQRLRKHYPKLREIYNTAVYAGAKKAGFVMTIRSLPNFPYSLPTRMNKDQFITEDADVREGY